MRQRVLSILGCIGAIALCIYSIRQTYVHRLDLHVRLCKSLGEFLARLSLDGGVAIASLLCMVACFFLLGLLLPDPKK